MAGANRNVIETVMGGVVLAVAGLFLVFAYSTANVGGGSGGYELIARFDSVSGLAPGSDVRVAGVKVGTVTGQELDPKSFLAVIRMNIASDVRLPRDTVAVVASESLLGGRYMQLQPGGEEELLKPGERIEYTQSTPGIEQLLGQVIFSLQNMGKDQGAPAAPGAAPAPATP